MTRFPTSHAPLPQASPRGKAYKARVNRNTTLITFITEIAKREFKQLHLISAIRINAMPWPRIRERKTWQRYGPWTDCVYFGRGGSYFIFFGTERKRTKHHACIEISLFVHNYSYHRVGSRRNNITFLKSTSVKDIREYYRTSRHSTCSSDCLTLSLLLLSLRSEGVEYEETTV